jgi:hypothetical protein
MKDPLLATPQLFSYFLIFVVPFRATEWAAQFRTTTAVESSAVAAVQLAP